MVLYYSIGSIIIDDIATPDGFVHSAILGGGVTHAAMGMRVWNADVGLASAIGIDFSGSNLEDIKRIFGCRGLVKRNIRIPYAHQTLQNNGIRTEEFLTSYKEMIQNEIRPGEIPEEYRLNARGIHLHSHPLSISSWVKFLKAESDPIVIWEPWDPFCLPENRPLFRELFKFVDIFSPNLREAKLLTGLEEPHEILNSLLDDGAPIVALRMGENGSLVGKNSRELLHFPAYPVEHIVDTTGAGNAYCGGFVVGFSEDQDLFQAGCYATISASFAIRQYGALYSEHNLHNEAQKCLSKYKTFLRTL